MFLKEFIPNTIGVSSGGEDGISSIPLWDNRPSAPDDGDLVYIEEESKIFVAKDGYWIPEYQVGSRTLTIDTNLGFGLPEDLSDVVTGGWVDTGVTKTAGNPLVINGTFSSSRIVSPTMPGRYLLRMEYSVSSSQGWMAIVNPGPTRRINIQYTSTEIREANGSSVTTEGPWTSTGPLYILADWTGSEPVVSTWAPGMTNNSIPIGTLHAPDDLESYGTVSNASKILIVGAYSGSATYSISDLRIWEIS